jgi:hypothetical protein
MVMEAQYIRFYVERIFFNIIYIHFKLQYWLI